MAPEPIKLVDNTIDEDSESQLYDANPVRGSGGVWAKDVKIPEYQTVQGTTKAGAYVVWVIKIQKITEGTVSVCRRYSEFVTFREQLVKQFPKRIKEIPELPPKSVIARFRPDFLEVRRQGLQYFLLCIVLNPAFATGDLVRRFVS